MPTYEYQCAKCGQQTEAFQKISDAPLTDCPKCHQPTLTKQLSASGFQLKGSGWYVTDYSKKGKAAAKEDKAANAPAVPAETKKTDNSSSSDQSGTGAST